MMENDISFIETSVNVNNFNENDAKKNVMKAMFAVNDITLYLDTHPQDKEALNLHKQYVNDYEKAKKYYENNFGPLSIFANMNNWQWVYNKWPWEGEME